MIATSTTSGRVGSGEAGGSRVVAIDGPSGTGKSTVARSVARALGAGYLDTGALYRMVALHVLDGGIDPADDAAVANSLQGLVIQAPTDPAAQRHDLEGHDVTQRIRDDDVTAAVTPVSANPAVREFLLGTQRGYAYSRLMVVEGRDIGTVVVPDAAVKIYLTADAGVRAQRRFRQDMGRDGDGGAHGDAGESREKTDVESGAAGAAAVAGSTVRRAPPTVHDVAASLRARDQSDSTRAHAPLAAADDAVVVDSTLFSVDQTVEAVLAILRDREFGSDEAAGGESHPEADRGPRAGADVPQSLPVRWFRLGGMDDPVPPERTARDVDRGRRIGIGLSYLLYRMKVHGEEQIPPAGPVVVVANHTTFMDGPVLFGRLPRRISFLIKTQIFRFGPLGWLLRTVGQYEIDPDSPQRHVLMAALNQLKADGAVGIFPEGHRTDGSASEVFNGAGWMAVRSGATVVPVALRGTARPEGRRRRRFRPRIYALVGTPFTVKKGAGRSAVKAATDMIQQRLVATIADLDRGMVAAERQRARSGIRWRSA